MLGTQMAVLVLAGLIFRIVAVMVLCFGFVLKTVLTKHWFFSGHTVSRPFLLLISSHEQVGCGWARRWERTQLAQRIPADQRSIPYHMMLCLPIKSVPCGRKGVHSEVVFPSNRCVLWSPVSRSWLNTCLLMGSSEWMPYFICAEFLIYPRVFSLLPFKFSPSSHSRAVR